MKVEVWEALRNVGGCEDDEEQGQAPASQPGDQRPRLFDDFGSGIFVMVNSNLVNKILARCWRSATRQ